MKNKETSTIKFEIKELPKIPNMVNLRYGKESYKQIPIDFEQELSNDELVNIHDFGIAGQSYYSRPNDIFEFPVTGVPKTSYLRKTVAEKLAVINQLLNSRSIDDFFRGEVELYIEDGVRLLSVQEDLYDNVFPGLIRKQYPNIPNDALNNKRKDLIAEPSVDEDSPSPHLTGGAVDVILRYKQSNKLYVPDCEVNMREKGLEVDEANYPDYYETIENPRVDQVKIRDNRRAFYNIMTGKAFGADTEFACNPTEWWHWSYGDQLWAYAKNQPQAFYSIAERADKGE